MLRIISFLVVFLCLATCREERHFITDTAYRRTVEEDFEHKKQLLSGSQEDLFLIFNQPLTLEEREALEFIYAYAPLTDLATYGGDFLLKNVRQSLKVRAEMPWGKEIPEAIFRHFVLPVRGHNEGLDSSRFVFYRELRERVLSCKTMEEAALEVNHWCHEKAIYQPTNGRTCAPLTMTTTAYGRCGEESVFALAAMRSVGIPARQVYTPRWAHCDDNHAWIEVWTDGQWKYLGACEPEPRLDIAWFTAPVRRGLYIEARVFGKYKSDEEITAMNANLTAVNVTSHYTDVKKAVIRVVDSAGRPVEGASVEYKIYNYGEYYPAVTLTTDKQGISSLTVGQGDWIIWASKDGKFGFGELEAAHRDTLKIVMDKGGNEKEQYAYHIIPPVEKEYQALVKDEERAENDRRFMREDSIRNAYIATFMTEDAAQEKAKAWGYPFKSFFRYIQAARGNYVVVLRFLEGESGKGEERKAVAMELLDVLPEKDLQDTPADVWLANLGQDLRKEYQDLFPTPENTDSVQTLATLIARMTHILHEPSTAATYYLKGALCELFDFLSSGFYVTPVHLSSSPESLLFLRISRLLEDTDGRLPRSELARLLNYNGSYLNSIVQRRTGLCLFDYGMTFCFQKAERLLRETTLSVSEIALQLKFTNRTHFYELFRQKYGMTPQQWRKMQKSAEHPE